MSPINEDKADQRHVELRILSLNGGITATTVLNEHIQELFDLPSGDPTSFVRNLTTMRDESADTNAMEAALNALGFGSPAEFGLDDRRMDLLMRRRARGEDPVNGLHDLEADEIRGFAIIAGAYELAAMINDMSEMTVSA